MAMMSSESQDVPPDESPSVTTSTEGTEQAWSTIATDGGGILQEYVEEGILGVDTWLDSGDGAHEDTSYFCNLCCVWCNGHEQAIVHLFRKAHAKNNAHRAGQGP